MRTTFLILLALTTLPVVAQQEGDVSHGATVYGVTCGRCHQARSPLERSDNEWVTIALHMRSRANLTGRQVQAVLAFLQATNGDAREQAPDLADDSTTAQRPLERTSERIDAGRALVTARACIGCHVIGGVGGAVGPALAGVVQRRGLAFVRQKIANPALGNAATMMPRFGLTAEEIDAVIAYLETLTTTP
ncbi:MAG: c-type cytochrome [Gemmatimonadales bacterium]